MDINGRAGTVSVRCGPNDPLYDHDPDMADKHWATYEAVAIDIRQGWLHLTTDVGEDLSFPAHRVLEIVWRERREPGT